MPISAANTRTRKALRSRGWINAMRRRPIDILILLAVVALWAFAAAGCMSTPKQTIPHRGEVVAQGSGQLSFRAPEPGLVSIYDVNTDSVIHSTAVVKGSVVS